jgi:nucleoside-diphosphate-sugar epimerase
MRILVTGASGFVGSLLVRRLYADGHGVRALARDPQRVHGALAGEEDRAALEELEIVRGDALTSEGLAEALEDVEVAYYLIHSIERPPTGGSPFPERDRLAAENFASAAARAGVRRIVYLGGLVPRGGAEEPGSSERRSRSPLIWPAASRSSERCSGRSRIRSPCGRRSSSARARAPFACSFTCSSGCPCSHCPRGTRCAPSRSTSGM